MIDQNTLNLFSYGLFVLSAREGDKDNGCIINTAAQVTVSPCRISITVNKDNKTCEMIQNTGKFNLSILTEQAPFSTYQRFGFVSGRDTDKFADEPNKTRSENGLYYLTKDANAVVSATVVTPVDCGTHIIFIADVDEARTLNDQRSVTYAYYHRFVKNLQKPKQVKGWICLVCGYVYEGEELPDDFICPLCGHGVADFEKIEDTEQTQEKGGEQNMKYACDICGWEYDEEVGYPEGGIAPGTKFEDLPDDFVCPLCGVGKDNFSAQ